jgi:hypothetical protein
MQSRVAVVPRELSLLGVPLMGTRWGRGGVRRIRRHVLRRAKAELLYDSNKTKETIETETSHGKG